MNLDTDLRPFLKINWKWIIGLNVKDKTVKLLGENIEENLHDLGFINELSDKTPKAQFMKEKKSWDFMKIKFFHSAKHMVKRIKRLNTDWEKIFAKHISDKELVPKIYKELLKHNTKTTQFKNGQNIWTDTSPKKIYRWQISKEACYHRQNPKVW